MKYASEAGGTPRRKSSDGHPTNACACEGKKGSYSQSSRQNENTNISPWLHSMIWFPLELSLETTSLLFLNMLVPTDMPSPLSTVRGTSLPVSVGESSKIRTQPIPWIRFYFPMIVGSSEGGVAVETMGESTLRGYLSSSFSCPFPF